MQNKQAISEHLAQVRPWDAQEAEDIAQAFRWLTNARKDRHFVVYNVVLNESCTALLFVHHRATDLWLPCGGHIEPNETPSDAAARELREELGIEPTPIDGKVFFVSISPGEEESLHVCLWLLFQTTCHLTLNIDHEELIAANWFPRDALPVHASEPHLARFIQKFDARRGTLQDSQ
ncbi:NUDIX hydrolase [Anatilimnocola sp. NA78]|uniref:NUDIX hydrolase n=1 Tax=Anatilimnocola sp. NA78 TaxID=3415683 RepID=UPI003CE57EA4